MKYTRVNARKFSAVLGTVSEYKLNAILPMLCPPMEISKNAIGRSGVAMFATLLAVKKIGLSGRQGNLKLEEPLLNVRICGIVELERLT
jgi:hypothetical protein